MSYAIKEVFFTLQGEGANSGRPAVFCRFSGCNLWSGREEDRAAAICSFCDTDFVGVDGPNGARYGSATSLAEAVADAWGPKRHGSRFVVLTGGEPLLQVDEHLVNALHERQFVVAVETNGTVAVPAGIDWVCVSPKGGSLLRVRSGDELKLVYPQNDLQPDDVAGLDFQHFFLQPKDGPNKVQNAVAAIRYCLNNPQWKMSIQMHKVLGIP